MKYSSSFYYDLDLAEKGEDWINQIFTGGYKVEVKIDYMAHITGNLFVEIMSRGKYSGLSTTEANYWIFIIYFKNYCLILQTEKLKQLCKHYHSIKGFVNGGDNNTSKGVLIPIKSII